MRPEEGAPSDNTTLLTELERFRSDGYDGDFLIRSGPVLVCRACDHRIDPTETDLDALRRLEGASDPADMVAILALECPNCGAKGTAVAAYGPTASEDEDALLRALPDDLQAGGTPEQTS